MALTEIRLSGSGGQGILLACRILAEALTLEGHRIAQSQSYEPTSRGGLSRSDLIAGDGSIDYPLATRLDYLVILDPIAAAASAQLVHPGSRILRDTTLAESGGDLPGHHYLLPMSDTARELQDTRSTNMVALGALVKVGDLCSADNLSRAVSRVTPDRLVPSSLAAIEAGRRIAGEALAGAGEIRTQAR